MVGLLFAISRAKLAKAGAVAVAAGAAGGDRCILSSQSSWINISTFSLSNKFDGKYVLSKFFPKFINDSRSLYDCWWPLNDSWHILRDIGDCVEDLEALLDNFEVGVVGV